MPSRAQPRTAEEQLAEIEARLRALELHTHIFPEAEEGEGGPNFPAYSWQSSFAMTPGPGHKLFADRPGSIVFCRAERSAGDGTTDAEFDVFKNGSTIYTTNTPPSVPAGETLGAERSPNNKAFKKGDAFHIEILDNGGGTGPLRVTIFFTEQ